MEQSICNQILSECQQKGLAENSEIFIVDVYIPYKADQLPSLLEEITDPFRQRQRAFLGLNIPEQHHRWIIADSKRYESVRGLAESRIDEVDINGSKYVRKRTAKPSAIDPRDQECVAKSFWNEITCMKRCSQRHIVKFKESYTDETYFGIIMLPVAECNLRQFMEKDFVARMYDHYPLENFERDLESFFGCLLTAMCYLRGKEIRHRDIKPENILVKFNQDFSSQPTVLICDLGLAHDFSGERRDTTESNRQGTPRYKAPELVAPHRLPHKEETDVWSLGCVFVELHTIISGFTLIQLFQTMSQDGNDQPDEYWSYHERRLKTLQWVDEMDARADEVAPGSHLRGTLIKAMLGQTPSDRKKFHSLRQMLCQHDSMIGDCCRGNDLQGAMTQESTSSYYDLGNRTTDYLNVRRFSLYQRNRIDDDHDRYEDWRLVKDFNRCKISLYIKSSQNPWETVLYISLDEREDADFLWLPKAFTRSARDGMRLDLEWSDCKQATRGPPDGAPGHVGRSVYKWEHLRDRPNNVACIDFEQHQDAADFARTLLFQNPEDVPVTMLGVGNHNHISVEMKPWFLSGPPERMIGQRILNNVSALPGVSSIRKIDRVVQLRRYFLPEELDIWLERTWEESKINAELRFNNALEPLYLSNHPESGTKKPEKEIEPDVPTLTNTQQAHIQLGTIAHNLNLVNHHVVERLFESLSFWKLVWYGSCHALMKLSQVCCCFTYSSRHIRGGDLMVWKTRSSPICMRLAIRSVEHSDGQPIWIVLEDVEISEGNKKQGVHVIAEQRTLGNLINLGQCRAGGDNVKVENGRTTWQITFESIQQKMEFVERMK